MHLQHSRHYSVSSHNQNFTSPLLVRGPRRTVHCRTEFFQRVPVFISRPDSTRGGSRHCRNSMDFSLEKRDIAARFPGRASNLIVLQNAQTGSGADPLSYLQGTGGFSPKGKATVPWYWPLKLHIALKFRNGGCSSNPLTCRHDTEPNLRFFFIVHVSCL